MGFIREVTRCRSTANIKTTMQRKEVETNTILLCLTGSRLYGIDNIDSDYDYKGICIPPLKYFFGNFGFFDLE